jgi:putative transposase
MEIKNTEKEYTTKNHLIFSCQYHVIFCPKYRRRILTKNIEKRLKELILEKQIDYDYKVLDMDIMPDHVHLLLDVNPKIGIYRTVSKIKGYTSHTLREEFPEIKRKLPTLWTLSRFISSVGAVTLDVVKKYIENQKGK